MTIKNAIPFFSGIIVMLANLQANEENHTFNVTLIKNIEDLKKISSIYSQIIANDDSVKSINGKVTFANSDKMYSVHVDSIAVVTTDNNIESIKFYCHSKTIDGAINDLIELSKLQNTDITQDMTEWLRNNSTTRDKYSKIMRTKNHEYCFKLVPTFMPVNDYKYVYEIYSLEVLLHKVESLKKSKY